MLSRCTNQNDPYFSRYGGRGIKVCASWSLFENFLADMGERQPALTLERKDNDLDYTPDNCVWATRQQQSINRSNTRWFEIDGERQHLSEWCRRFKVSHQAVLWRLSKGWPVEAAFKTPT